MWKSSKDNLLFAFSGFQKYTRYFRTGIYDDCILCTDCDRKIESTLQIKFHQDMNSLTVFMIEGKLRNHRQFRSLDKPTQGRQFNSHDSGYLTLTNTSR